MNSLTLKALAACTILSGLLTACVDDGYDLSNIDTTSAINVDNLTVPVNIDEVKMASIFDLKENEVVKVVNGEYCIVKEGDFKSDPIKIDPVTLTCNSINPTSKTFDLSHFGGVIPPELPAVELDLSAKPSNFDINTSNTPECIKSIVAVTTDMNVTLTLSLQGFSDNLKGFMVKDIKLILPKGLIDIQGPGSYNASTGIYSISSATVNGNAIDLPLHIGGLNLAEAGIVFNEKNHTIAFKGEIGVQSATAVIKPSDLLNLNNIPASITYRTDYRIDPIKVKTFSGGLGYDVTDLDIPRVDIGSMPDILSQEGTNIVLANPQVYLQVNNPVSQYSATAEFGLSISPVRDGKPGTAYTMDSPLKISAANSTFCLSPSKPAVYPEAFAGAVHHPYTSLGKVLEGQGIPTALDFEVIDPVLDASHVVDFALGQTLQPVEGKYTLIAPFALGAGSQIVYAADMTGWGDDDLDKLLIKELRVKAKVTTDVPVSLQFTGYPIDRDGNQIGNVTITGASVDANAKDQELEIVMTGDVQRLDGISYRAVAAPKPGEDASALRNDMNIILKEVRATVSGTYTTDF